MALRLLFLKIITFAALNACSNVSDFETGEITAIKMLRETWLASRTPSVLFDTRDVVTRKKIDGAKIPVLFVELENGQNGTLTPFPGEGVGETWLGADGATITLENGVLKATRGMKGDLMGSTSSMPIWSKIKESPKYTRELAYLNGNNQVFSQNFDCQIKADIKQVTINIFSVPFSVLRFDEICNNGIEKIKNTYFLDNKGIVRKSLQYQGPTLGFLSLERLDRL